MPWVSIPVDKEYRVFVYNNKITAISQQHLYDVYKDTIEEHYENHITIINSYFELFIKHHIQHISSYCIDIAVLEGDRPYFIEINPFGKEYSSGSSLFGWVEDWDILIGNITPESDEEPDIYFRYTI